jgi:hypothetical protein
MRAWYGLLRRFWRGLCTNWIGTAGVVLATTGFVGFVFAELLRVVGLVTNAYVGLLTYLALPALFVIGLCLVPVGWWLAKRRLGKTSRELLSERFDEELVTPRARGSRVFQTIALLTLINIVFLSIGGARMLQFMDEPRFCGTACHSVMGPEWATYQQSPHARVKCVECHVGEGAKAAFDAKLNGAWQMISVTFGLYEKPIPAPVHNLRPARETCERCHWPDKFYGQRIKRIVRYAQDEDSTPRFTTLALKVGSGKGIPGQIHWHVAAKNEVRYMPGDPKRLSVRWVEVKQPDGRFKRYDNTRWRAPVGPVASPQGKGHKTKKAHALKARTFDCVDCHNRATHIYEDPEDAVDQRITSGAIDRSLPFAKRQALGALLGSYSRNKGVALEAVARDFRGFYRKNYPKLSVEKGRAIERATRALQKAYAPNIHPAMNIGWNTYPSHIGHRQGRGCMRCHNKHMVDEAGRAVPHGCTMCHSMMAHEDKTPFATVAGPNEEDPACKAQMTLRRELTGVSPKAGACGVRRKKIPPAPTSLPVRSPPRRRPGRVR